jgi:hypothetical protein
MKIVLALVKRIGGELHCSSGENDRGARFGSMTGAEQVAMPTAKEKH